ncbi:uncharacterized protein LOC108094780 [Drosophila ficusphila]|uniref:uncharacterized protein LOC108094780 n=1 Tax=Drosophila ficusphila TaxID=30025 RepID=UPI0007E64C38|nr:uncharacterized protein LOC108094780 [Drosophila ficusphila]XP_017051042.1 uncharacterized protein LOC108094780 [Drosophila ficusphila]
MHSYEVLEGVLLAVTFIIILWVQGIVALPLAQPDPKSLSLGTPDNVSAERAPRQINLNHSSIDFHEKPPKFEGFRVFGKKLQNDYHRKPVYNETKAPPTSTTKKSTFRPKKITKYGIRLFPAPDGEEENGEEAGDGGGEAGGGGNDTKKELTVRIPNFQTNKFGEKVYNPWGVTFGHRFLDTRFGKDQAPRMSINPHPIQNYYPKVDNLTSVCVNKSTIYNDIKVEKWIIRHVYSRKKKIRPFFFGLRREIYESANSEQCHTVNYSDWQQYQECAIRRNQLMEYYIPKYPRIQLAAN